MAYNQNSPGPNDQINTTQPVIQGNFQAIKTLVDINHVTFDDPSGNQGKHKFVQFPEQLASPATAANEVALFSTLSTLSAQTELSIRNENNGTVYEFTSALKNAIGWTRLPSGILLKWGNGSGTGLTTYTFPVAATIPVFSAVYAVLPIASSGGVATDVDEAITFVDSSTVQFRVYCSQRSAVANATVNFQFLAIGL